MKQADTGCVPVNNRFCSPAFIFQLVEAILRLLKLRFKRFVIYAAVRSYLVLSLSRLRFR
jgi:hypothetical protein